MSHYVDGYVLPIATDRIEAYREMAAEAGKAWIDHGALRYVEAIGDDLEPDVAGAELARFPDLVGAGPDETVVFAFVVYESREHRDEVNAAVMAAFEDAAEDPTEMPFDVERMAYGGFEAVVEYGAEPTGEPLETAGEGPDDHGGR